MLEKVDSAVDDGVLEGEHEHGRKGFWRGGMGLEKVLIDLDDNDAETLVGASEVGEKEVDVDVTDSEEEENDECGVKRKRTIRVVIRSRAFL